MLDDIATLMDDTISITKLAIKKTAPVLGDDLALGAKQVSGYSASREIPVLIAITKGSFLNKLIILPIVFLLSYFANFLIPYILIIGGLYLAYEGSEKVYEIIEEKFFHKKKVNLKSRKKLTEKEKIKSAIMTDFVLSIEIIVIALNSVLNEPFLTRLFAVSVVAILATVGIYATVAFLVRMDDIGFILLKNIMEKVFFIS